MTDPMRALFQFGASASQQFPITSRYSGIETATLERPGQTPVRYLRRRFVPSAEGFQLLNEHTVTAGQRLDNIAAAYLGDPLQFWRICDGNSAMRPDALTETPGRRLRIGLPGSGVRRPM